MPYVANELLDLPVWLGQRAERVEYVVIDRTGQNAGSVTPEATGAQVQADITANIPRQLSGLTLRSEDYAHLDPFGDKIAPFWVLSDRSRWPLGIFHFTGAPDNGQEVKTSSLFDTTIILDSLTDRAFGADSNSSVTGAMDRVVSLLGLTALVDGSDMQIGADQPVGWPSGGQSWAVILRFLCNLCGFLPPWFDVNGVLHLEAPKPLVIGATTLTYFSAGSRVHPLPVSDPHLLDAPNLHIVLSTGATTEDISAAAVVDPALPFSIEHRGFAVPKVHRLQGIANDNQAQIIAVRLAAQAQDSFNTREFVTTPDPRHELAEVIGFDGIAERETSWTLQLEPGGDMTHRTNRSEAVTVET